MEAEESRGWATESASSIAPRARGEAGQTSDRAFATCRQWQLGPAPEAARAELKFRQNCRVWSQSLGEHLYLPLPRRPPAVGRRLWLADRFDPPRGNFSRARDGGCPRFQQEEFASRRARPGVPDSRQSTKTFPEVSGLRVPPGSARALSPTMGVRRCCPT